ncbi:MAG: hypothetical protein FJ126_11920 [Deltaproteobacteria bacterium]|nr:hypothetical protein [Deltaproteobacteria bacterium]
MLLRSRVCWAVLLAAAICGCAVVASVEPVGERPKEVSPDEWGGAWIHKDHPIKIKVTDPRKGVLQVAWVEEKGGSFVLESYQIELREAGAWTLGNVKAREGSAPYLWGLVKNDHGQIIIWTPAPEYFKKLVQTGVLPGQVEKGGDVVLEKLTSEHLNLMISEDKGVGFDWKQPLVFFRVGK